MGAGFCLVTGSVLEEWATRLCAAQAWFLGTGRGRRGAGIFADVWHLKVLSTELVRSVAAEPSASVHCGFPHEDLFLCRVEKVAVETPDSSGSSGCAPETATEPEKH